MNITSQILITVFGGAAIWLVNCRSERARRWGPIFGIIGQPFWYVQLVIHEQWFMLPVYIWYTAAWIRGCLNFSIMTHKSPARRRCLIIDRDREFLN